MRPCALLRHTLQPTCIAGITEVVPKHVGSATEGHRAGGTKNTGSGHRAGGTKQTETPPQNPAGITGSLLTGDTSQRLEDRLLLILKQLAILILRIQEALVEAMVTRIVRRLCIQSVRRVVDQVT